MEVYVDGMFIPVHEDAEAVLARHPLAYEWEELEHFWHVGGWQGDADRADQLLRSIVQERTCPAKDLGPIICGFVNRPHRFFAP